MNSKELRIGNLVKYVKEVDTFGGKETEIGCRDLEDTDFYEPIKLTEEWLLKFGFEYVNLDMSIYKKNKINIIPYGDNIFKLWISTPIGTYTHDLEITNVNQLQNLYFALTGEELQYS